MTEDTMETNAAPTREEILRAGRLLAGVCDGARSVDGMGYNKFDAPSAKSIIGAASPTDRQVRSLWHILRKYKKQLSGHGVEFDALVPPELPPRTADGRLPVEAARVRIQWVQTDYGRRIAFGANGYNAGLVAALKGLERRWFDKEGKNSGGIKNAWLIPDDLDSLDAALGAVEALEPRMELDVEPDLKEAMDKVRDERRRAYEASRADSADIEVATKLPLRPFQKAGVKWVEDMHGRALIGDEMGCVDGNAEVMVQRTGITRRLTLRELYEGWERWDHRRRTNIRALVDGEFHQHEIVDVLDKGVRPVVEILLESGKRLKVTPDHEVCVDVGRFAEARNLRKGDAVLTNGTAICHECGSRRNICTYRYARFRGYCRKCIYRKKRAKPTWVGGRFVDGDGYVRVSGMHGHPRAGRGGFVYEHLLVMEKMIGRPVRLSERVHHRNEIKHDNVPGNLELKSVSGHMALHGRKGGYLRLDGAKSAKGGIVRFIPLVDRVVSVKEAGEAHVYDVVCRDPHRNFVANGVVVHNCGKTPQALGYLARHPEALPALIVCPATLRVNWYREVAKFTGLRAMVITSKTSLKAFQKLGVKAALAPEPDHDAYIVNYDLFETQTPKTWIRALQKGDESGVPNLLAAGQYALRELKKAYEKERDIEARTRLLAVIGRIQEQGGAANRRRFVKVIVNGTPLEQFMTYGFRSLIGDEIHYCKEPDSQRSMAMKEISKALSKVVGLTGTPILNRPRELWSLLNIINPEVYPDFMAYAMRHCAAFQKPAGRRMVWDFSGASNLEELERTIRTRVMIRRTKDQVLKELPKKMRITVPIFLDERLKAYEEKAKPAMERLAKLRTQRDEWRARLAAMEPEARKKYLMEHAEDASRQGRLSNIMIEEIEELKQAAVDAKFDDCVKFVLNAQEQQGKVLVFMTHHKSIDRMTEALSKEGLKVDKIDGRIDGPKRDPIKDRFQEGDLEVLVCGIRAVGEGLNLTACHTVIKVEFDWNPAKHHQAEDRVHRIGQTVPSTIYYLVGLGTIEEKIAEMIDSKREVVNAALGEGDRTVDETGILDAILEDLLGNGGGKP